ncbi:MAG: 3-hydroxyacyl-ACP dehydratase FabZ [Buchnera aphidicola (Nurudea shiraii)]
MCILISKDISKILPHQYPFIFIDKIIKYVRGKYVIAVKNVNFKSSFLKGHFPNYPIFPGVLILESILQTACFLAFKSMTELCKKKLFYFSSIDYAKFRKKVFPGDTMIIYVNILNFRTNIMRFHGNVVVNEKMVCDTQMSVVYSR